MATAHQPDRTGLDGGEDVAWVSRVNARWIVHGGLNDTAAAYMDRLGGTDPRRLALSCRIARALTGKAGAGEDPKAWFYAGLFSMARPAEVAEFLLGHRLSTAILVSDPPVTGSTQAWPEFSPATRETIRRIRAAIADLSPGNLHSEEGSPGAAP